MSLVTFKKLLEPYVGVAAENFRASCIPRSEIETRPLALDSCRDDGKTVWLKLGGDLRLGEFKVALFELDLESETEVRVSCNRIINFFYCVDRSTRFLIENSGLSALQILVRLGCLQRSDCGTNEKGNSSRAREKIQN